MTALVLTNVTRCEYGEDLSLGYVAEALDRVEIVRVWATSTGKLYRCRNADGETFPANEEMIQLDSSSPA